MILPIQRRTLSKTASIRPKERDGVLQALRAGVVPRVGQHLIQVGRAREVESLLRDIERIADGGSAFRIVVGAYGAGKTRLKKRAAGTPTRWRW